MDIFVFNWIFSDVFGSLGSQGEHCLDLPTYLSSIGSLATCLVRLVLGRTLFGFADIFVFNWIFSDVFGSLGFQGEHCLDFADIFVFNWIFSDVFGSRWFGFRAVVLRV